MNTRIRWIRPPRQARSAATQQRLLDAAEALVAEKSFAEASVAEISRRAGFSVGAFYSRFRDKHALLHCLEERFLVEASATVEAALDPARWVGASIPEIAEEVIAFLVQMYRERFAILREFLGHSITDPEVGMRTERLVQTMCERLSALLLQRAAEMSHPDPATATRFACRLLLGVLKEAVLFGAYGAYGVPRSDEKLSQELTRAFLGYLGVRAWSPVP